MNSEDGMAYLAIKESVEIAMWIHLAKDDFDFIIECPNFQDLRPKSYYPDGQKDSVANISLEFLPDISCKLCLSKLLNGAKV